MKAINLPRQYRGAMSIAHQLGLNTEALWEPTQLLIQHCLPPATIHDLKALLQLLITIDLDANWGIKFELELMLERANAHNTASAVATRKVGRSHPVYFGIQRINDLPWPNNIKAKCIDEFVTLVYATTAPSESVVNTEYYMDVYQTRDVLICKYSDIFSLKVHAHTRSNFGDKLERFSEVSANRRSVGAIIKMPIKSAGFWSQPPRLYLHQNRKEQDSLLNLESAESYFTSNEGGVLSSEFQLLTGRRRKLNWDRENVPSISDQNHLGHSKIVHYIRHLLANSEHALAALAIITYSTSLAPRRLYEIQQTQQEPSVSNDIFYNASTGILSFGVFGGATNFESKTKLSKSEIVTLQIPKPFNTFLVRQIGQFKELITKDYPLNAYSKRNLGVRPTLARISKSSLCNLHFKELLRTDVFLMRGKIPIQHQNESAYFTANNATLDDHFQKTLLQVISQVDLFNYLEPSLQKAVYKLATNPPGHSYPLGSQLGNAGPYDFYNACTTSISQHLEKAGEFSAQQRVSLVAALNDLEVYYYFLLQFANAGRAVGPNTNHELNEKYSIYRDKDSKHFKEKLFITTSPLVLEQFDVLKAFREKVLKATSLYGIYYQYDGSPNLAYQIEVDDAKKVGQIKKLNALSACKYIKAQWGIQFPFGRPNTPRHMSSSFSRSESNETIANAWLNHHIDGYAPFSPTSPTNCRELFTELQRIRDQWLLQNNFKIINELFCDGL